MFSFAGNAIDMYTLFTNSLMALTYRSCLYPGSCAANARLTSCRCCVSACGRAAQDAKKQGFSRVMMRPAGRATGCSNCHGSGRVGSGSAQNSRVESGRVKRFSSLAGRVWSCQEFFKSHGSGRVGSIMFQISRVGSGHDPRETGRSRVGPA